MIQKRVLQSDILGDTTKKRFFKVIAKTVHFPRNADIVAKVDILEDTAK